MNPSLPLPLQQPSTVGEFHFACPKCSQSLRYTGHSLPQDIRCSACGNQFAATSASTLRDAATVAKAMIDAPRERGDRPHAGNKVSIPDFEVEEVLGEGGMGIVYKARDRKLNRTVALKMIRAARIADPEDRERTVARFRREAEAVARLQHPNIVQIFFIGEVEQGPFFAMEHIDGGTLSSMARNTPIEPKRAASLVRTLAIAIHHAHAQQIVHRDLKPGNVLLHFPPGAARTIDQAIPKIADFGLAKEIDPGAEQHATMGVVGTPSYMAPEQASARHAEVGPPADVYALGAILYDLLTGRPPFKGASVLDTLEQVRTQEPVPPSRLQPRLPRDLEVICLKCLQKEPRRRYLSAESLAQDLERFLSGQAILARPTGRLERTWKWMRRYPARAAVTLLSLLTVAGLFGAILWDRDRTIKHAEQLSDQNRKTEEANKLAVKNEEAAKKESAEKEIQRLRALEKTIRLTVGAGLKLQQEGEGLTALLHFAEAAALEDPRSSNAWLHDARLAACLNLYPLPGAAWTHRDAVTRVAFSPDGRHVLSGSVDGTVQVRLTKDGTPALANPLKHAAAVNDACFSPDGKRILTASEDKTARLWDTGTGEPASPPLAHPFPVLQVAFDPVSAERMLAVVGNRNALATQRELPRPMVPQRIVTGVGPNGVPRYTTIMVPGPAIGTTRREAVGRVELWEDFSSGKPNRTLSALGWVQHAAFSADGLRVVTANASLEKVNSVALWSVKDAEKPPFIKLPHLIFHASISPDGSRIAAATGHAEKGVGEARLFDSATQQPIGSVMKHRGPVTMIQFSPDGKSIATASHDGTVCLWDAMGELLNEPMRHRDRVLGVWFSPDGRRLLTASSDGSARVWSAANGEPLTPFLQHGSSVTHAAFHPTAPLVAVGCAEGLVRLWNVEPKALERPAFKLQNVLPAPAPMTYENHYGTRVRKVTLLPGRAATGVRFDRTGDRLIVAAGQKFREVTPGNQSEALTGYKTTHLAVFDTIAVKIVETPWKHEGAFEAGWIGPDGAFARIRGDSEDAKDRRFEVRNGAGSLVVEAPLAKGESIRAVRVLAKGHAILLAESSAGKGKSTYRIKRLDVEKAPSEFPIAISGAVEDADFAEDGTRLAAIAMVANGKHAEYVASFWALGTSPSQVGSSVRIEGTPNRVLLNASGTFALVYASARSTGASGSDPFGFMPESEVQILNVMHGGKVEVKHRRPITHAEFSPAGDLVLTCSQDRTARVWHVDSGKPATPPLEHRDTVHHGLISQHGLIATAAADGARLWDASTGEPLTPFLPHLGGALEIALRPDERMAATAGADGSVRLWPIDRIRRDPNEWRRIAQWVSSHRLSSQGLTPIDTGSLLRMVDAVKP